MEGRVSLGFGLLSGKECCIAGESFPCLGEFDFFFFFSCMCLLANLHNALLSIAGNL